MKLNKQILEAINRGIQLALDDYQDMEDNNSISQSNDVIDTKDVIKDQIDFNKFFVDLGLSSGTIWAKYNLGVNPDKLETFKDWLGRYYAWGELEEKDDYVLETYKFTNVDENNTRSITKYNDADGKEELELEDDVAYQNPIIYKDKKYIQCIPTAIQFQELIIGTTHKYIRNYNNINGMHVIEYTSKTNGKQIIFPLCGYKTEEAALDALAIEGCYWTNCIDISNDFRAWQFAIAANYNVVSNHHSFRAYGLNIRPVLFKNNFVNDEIK